MASQFDPFGLLNKGILVLGAGSAAGVKISGQLRAAGANLICVDGEGELPDLLETELDAARVELDIETDAKHLFDYVDFYLGKRFRRLVDLTMNKSSWSGRGGSNEGLLHPAHQHINFIIGLAGLRLAANGGGSITFAETSQEHFARSLTPPAELPTPWPPGKALAPSNVRVNAVSVAGKRIEGDQALDGLASSTLFLQSNLSATLTGNILGVGF